MIELSDATDPNGTPERESALLKDVVREETC